MLIDISDIHTKLHTQVSEKYENKIKIEHMIHTSWAHVYEKYPYVSEGRPVTLKVVKVYQWPN